MSPAARIDLDTVLDVLRAFRPAARDAGIELVGVVGSVARGEARPDSDVDVVFDALSTMDYWRLGGVQMDLQEALGRRVDLVDRQFMKPERWAWMAPDLAAL